MKQIPALGGPRLLSFCLAALCFFAGTACDPVRAFLDMPTRGRVQSLRTELALRQARIQDSLQAASAADSLALIQAHSLAATDPFTETGTGSGTGASTSANTSANTSAKIEVKAEALTGAAGREAQRFWRYYLVAGSFRLEENARQLVERLQKNGFEAQTLLFRSGSTVVTVGGFDAYEPAAARMAELAPLPLFADGLWLYNSRRALHIE